MLTLFGQFPIKAKRVWNMALRAKQIWVDEVERRSSGYYSTPSFISDFIFHRMKQLRPDGENVLDPCVGKGEMTLAFKRTGHHVTGFDLIDFHQETTDDFRNEDFVEEVLRSEEDPLFSRFDVRPDYIVANPPYNCHEIPYIRKNKARIQARYGKDASLNMYALFIKLIVNIAPPGCLIGLIVSDSFLTASGYEELRKFIGRQAAIRDLHLCPIDLFRDQRAEVRTCVLILEKNGRKGSTRLSPRPLSRKQFEDYLSAGCFLEAPEENITLSNSRDRSEFIVDVPEDVLRLFRGRRLEDIAKCYTGISTGNDKAYLRETRSPEFSIPFYKNPASNKFFAPPNAYLATNYISIGSSVRNFMIRNSNIIEDGGLTCSSMGVVFSAAVRPDGSVCGVNPNIKVAEHDKFWLLSYLNSSLALFLIRSVMIRGNMITPGYLQRLPVPIVSEECKERLATLARTAHDRRSRGESVDAILEQIDHALFDELSFTPETIRSIGYFCQNPVKLS